jgi:hypothetical protein
MIRKIALVGRRRDGATDWPEAKRRQNAPRRRSMAGGGANT